MVPHTHAIMATLPTLMDTANAPDLNLTNGEIRFDHVTFKYGEVDVVVSDLSSTYQLTRALPWWACPVQVNRPSCPFWCSCELLMLEELSFTMSYRPPYENK